MDAEIVDNGKEEPVPSRMDDFLGLVEAIRRKMSSERWCGQPLISPKELQFVAATAYGLNPTEAAAMAGFEEPEISGKILMQQRNVKGGIQASLDIKGLTVDYLCDKVKDLCEAEDTRKDGEKVPNWRARSSGIDHLSKMHGVHKTTTIKAELSFEERLARLDVGITTEE